MLSVLAWVSIHALLLLAGAGVVLAFKPEHT